MPRHLQQLDQDEFVAHCNVPLHCSRPAQVNESHIKSVVSSTQGFDTTSRTLALDLLGRFRKLHRERLVLHMHYRVRPKLLATHNTKFPTKPQEPGYTPVRGIFLESPRNRGLPPSLAFLVVAHLPSRFPRVVSESGGPRCTLDPGVLRMPVCRVPGVSRSWEASSTALANVGRAATRFAKFR